MRVVYIAGPFRAENSWLMEKNIRAAEDLALQVWALGAAAICPHTNTRFYQGALPDQTWLDGDLAILKRCDALLTTDTWQESMGARAEVREAQRVGIRVFHKLWELEEWLWLKT